MESFRKRQRIQNKGRGVDPDDVPSPTQKKRRRHLLRTDIQELGDGTGPSTHVVAAIPAMQAIPAPRHIRARNLAQLFSSKMESYDETYAKLPIATIKGVRISLMSAEDIRNISGTRTVTSHSHGDKCKADTIYDGRLGPMTQTAKCDTCNRFGCVGHFGSIQLNKPCFSPILIKSLVHVLQCICINCGKLLMTAKEVKRRQLHMLPCTARLKKMYDICLNRHCEGETCPANPRFATRDSKASGEIACRYSDKKFAATRDLAFSMSSRKIKEKLMAITKADAELMGFAYGNHPVDMICDIIPVLPNNCKSPYSDGGFMRHTHIASQLKELIKIVNSNTNDVKVYNTLCNMICKSPQNSLDNADQATAMDQLQGKTSMLRGNALGKPGNQHMRSVSGPDSFMRFGDVRYPRENIMTNTKLVVITKRNLELVKSMCHLNTLTHYILAGTKVRRQMHPQYQPSVGDTVHRILLNGDWMLLNRQPTLHKGSVLAVRLLICTQLTVGLHMAYTTSLNADFDGDENNLYNMHSLVAESEARRLQAPKYNFISVASPAPMFGLVINGVTGAYLMSQCDVLVRKKLVNTLVGLLDHAGPERWAKVCAKMDALGLKSHTTRGMLSMLYPENLYYSRHGVQIVDGIHVTGRLTKSVVGPKSHSILHEIYLHSGPERAVLFLTEATMVVEEWFAQEGFSVSLSNFTCQEWTPEGELSNPYDDMIDQKFTEMTLQLKLLDRPVHNEEDGRIRDMRINDTLNITKAVGMELSKKHLNSSNPLFEMGEMGANTKGDVMKNCQMMCSVGQQYLSGEILPAKLSNRTRLLPCMDINDHSPLARGFVKESFYSGLKGPSLFCLQQGGREGLMDTSIQTAKTGDMHRKMVRGYCNVILDNNFSLWMGGKVMLSPIFNCGSSIESNVSVDISGDRVQSPFDFKQVALELNGQAGWVKREAWDVLKKVTDKRSGDLGGLWSQTKETRKYTEDSITPPITSYEIAQMLGLRATALQHGAEPTFEGEEERWDGIDPISAAEREFQRKEYDMVVQRVMPNGEIKRLNPKLDHRMEFEYPMESWMADYVKVGYNKTFPTIIEDAKVDIPSGDEGRGKGKGNRRCTSGDGITRENIVDIAAYAALETIREEGGVDEVEVEVEVEVLPDPGGSRKRRRDELQAITSTKKCKVASASLQRTAKTQVGGSSSAAVDVRYIGAALVRDVPNSEFQTAYEFYDQPTPTGRRSEVETLVLKKVRDMNNLAKGKLITMALRDFSVDNTCNVLDACCGRGGDLFKWGPKVHSLMGMDASDSALQEMRARWRQNRALCRFKLTICKANFSRKMRIANMSTFDIVSCMMALNYLTKDDKTMDATVSNLCNSVQGNGIIILTYANSHAVKAWSNNAYCAITSVPEPHGYNFALGDGVVDAVEYHIDVAKMDMAFRRNGFSLVLRSSLVPFVSDQAGWNIGNVPNVEALAICNLYVVEMWKRENN